VFIGDLISEIIRYPCRQHHRISMAMSGLAFRSAAIRFLAWIAYIWLGPGSSEAIRLMPAWASVKIVILSGVICRLAAIYRPRQAGNILHRRSVGCRPCGFRYPCSVARFAISQYPSFVFSQTLGLAGYNDLKRHECCARTS